MLTDSSQKISQISSSSLLSSQSRKLSPSSALITYLSQSSTTIFFSGYFCMGTKLWFCMGTDMGTSMGAVLMLKTGGGRNAYSLGMEIWRVWGRQREVGRPEEGDCSFFSIERERLALTVARVLLIMAMKPQAMFCIWCWAGASGAGRGAGGKGFGAWGCFFVRRFLSFYFRSSAAIYLEGSVGLFLFYWIISFLGSGFFFPSSCSYYQYSSSYSYFFYSRSLFPGDFPSLFFLISSSPILLALSASFFNCPCIFASLSSCSLQICCNYSLALFYKYLLNSWFYSLFLFIYFRRLLKSCFYLSYQLWRMEGFLSDGLVSLTSWARSTGLVEIFCKVAGLFIGADALILYWISLVLDTFGLVVVAVLTFLFYFAISSKTIPRAALYSSKTLGILISIFLSYFWSSLISGTTIRCSLQTILKLASSDCTSPMIKPTSYSNFPQSKTPSFQQTLSLIECKSMPLTLLLRCYLQGLYSYYQN